MGVVQQNVHDVVSHVLVHSVRPASHRRLVLLRAPGLVPHLAHRQAARGAGGTRPLVALAVSTETEQS